MGRLYDGTFQVNSDVDGKYYFILRNKYISENPGVNYSSGVAPTDEEKDDTVVKEQLNEKD